MTSPCLNRLQIQLMPPAHDTLPQNYENQIFHISIFSLPEFLIFLQQLMTYLLERPKIRLLVFNSLWFPFQSSSDLPIRTRNVLLQRMQETLSKVCASTGVSVVVTTQLATKLVKDDGTAANFETGSRAILVPQPGLLDIIFICRI
ncbi:hypothetical protein QCA50_010711 [Cerrena zonata]|uniref:DNA recombination and repair protein Rad51-like C-terminal domain-containing protein n=1 Tax=Cerrena zonata TaxID=2478898 RepID=A0AAW0G2K1_9APHY